MRVDSENVYVKNQCSLVIRVDGDEIEIPVTFGMTADEIRMIYPFLLPLVNAKILNPAVQFVKANEQGLLADLSEEDYRNELIRVTEQSKYWYEKPEAGLLDIAVRFAIDLKMKGIEDLDFIFNRAPVYDPMKIKPLTELEANMIMEKLHIVGTDKDLDAFAELGKDSYADSTEEEIEQHTAVREQKKADTGLTEGVSDIISEEDRQESEKQRKAVSDIFGNMRKFGDESKIFDENSELAPDESKYMPKYDPTAKLSESELHDGRLVKFEEEDREEEELRRQSAPAPAPSTEAYSPAPYNSIYNDDGMFDDDDDDMYGNNSYDEGEPDDDDDDGLSFDDFDTNDDDNS